MKKYLLLKAGNGYQMPNKKKAISVLGKLYDGKPASKESLEIDGWGDCQIAAYTSTDGAMIINASDPKQYGELEWHHRDHIVMLREIPDAKNPRVIIYFCRIKDLFDAPSDQWIGKAGIKWSHVGKVAIRKEVYPTQDLL